MEQQPYLLHKVCGAEQEQQILAQCLVENDQKIHWVCANYTCPEVILGVSQKSIKLTEYVGDNTIVKRRTGGGAVYVGPWFLSLHLLLPKNLAVNLSVVQGYQLMAQYWLSCLQKINQQTVEQQLSMPSLAQIKASQEQVTQLQLAYCCFAGLSHGELINQNGQKLLGLAQHRTANYCVISSGIHLYAPNWQIFSRFFVSDLNDAMQRAQQLEKRVTDLRQLFLGSKTGNGDLTVTALLEKIEQTIPDFMNDLTSYY